MITNKNCSVYVAVRLCFLLIIVVGIGREANSQVILTRQFFEVEYGLNDVVEEACDAVYTSDFGYAIVGINESTAAGSHGLTVVKLDQTGSKQWTRRYQAITWSFDRGISIIQADDDDLVIVGFDEGGTNAIIIKLSNLDGTTVWNRIFGLDGSACTGQLNGNSIEAMNVAQMGGLNNDFVVVGSTIGDGNQDGDNIYIGRFNYANGFPVWQYSYTCGHVSCSDLVQEGLDLNVQGGIIRVVGSTQFRASQSLLRSDILNLTFDLSGSFVSGERLVLQKATDPVNSYPKAMWASDPSPPVSSDEMVIVGQIAPTNMVASPLGGFILRHSGGNWTAKQLVAPNTGNNHVNATDVEKYNATSYVVSGDTDHPNQSTVAFLMNVDPTSSWSATSQTYGFNRSTSAFHGLGVQPTAWAGFGTTWDEGVIGVGTWAEANGIRTNGYIVKTSFALPAVDAINCPNNDGVEIDDLTVESNTVEMEPICDFDHEQIPGDDPYIDIEGLCARQDHGPYGKNAADVQEAIVNGDLELRVYPSRMQSGDRLTIELPLVLSAYVTIRVTDLLGRELFHAVRPASAGGRYSIASTDWPAGTYMVHIRTETALSASSLIVID